jgi:hypothetical protein
MFVTSPAEDMFQCIVAQCTCVVFLDDSHCWEFFDQKNNFCLPTERCTVQSTNQICELNVLSEGIFFLSSSLFIGWRLSICICCKPFCSLLYNCQLLCFWRLALSTAVEVFPQPFSGYCSFKDVYCKLVMPNYMPYT